ncbi:hypothetical protein BH11PLA2_BH11PLA2_08720 [soil metagenome]
MTHASYKGIPPLAGLCTMEEALRPGLPVAECVRRLKRFHYAFVRLHGILTSRITAEPIYELKTAFAHHAYLCAEHATAIRQRVSEMREPPLGLDEVPHPALEAFFDEIQCAPTTASLVSGIYTSINYIHDAVSIYMGDTHPLTDAPTRRLLKFAWTELDEMMSFGEAAAGNLELLENHTIRKWKYDALSPLLAYAGGMDGTANPRAISTSNPKAVVNASGTGDVDLPRHFSKSPFQYDPVPRRDERFTDLWNQGVNAEAFLYSDKYPPKCKALMMLFKRIREIDVPEMMASILAESKGKPWGYYRDMARQIWDEARHAMMGEVGFTALGVDWTQCRVTWNWSHRLNTECTPLERHAVLFFIEQGLMPKTGKRYEYEVAHESGIPLMATIQDFDWADEVLHSQIGRQWLVPDFGGLQNALDFGDKAWAKITSNWTTVRDQGLTQHENWWPNVYKQACVAAGEEPNAEVLAFCETYETKRADIHRKA